MGKWIDSAKGLFFYTASSTDLYWEQSKSEQENYGEVIPDFAWIFLGSALMQLMAKFIILGRLAVNSAVIRINISIKGQK